MEYVMLLLFGPFAILAVLYSISELCIIPLSNEYKLGYNDGLQFHEKDTLNNAYIAMRQLTFNPGDEHKYASGYVSGCAEYERIVCKKSRCDEMDNSTEFISLRMSK